MEERYMYQVNTIMPILGLSIGTIKVPTSQNLTKDDVLICLKKAPVFRRFSDGNKERVGIDNIDRLHRENYMTVEEYNEYLANKTNDIVEEKVEEPVVEESEPEVAPIVEELVFRGYVYRVLKFRSNNSVACVVTAIIFALLHFNVSAFIPLFVFSMCLIKAYEDSSDIREPIVMHSLFNTVGVIGALIKV